MSNELVDTGEWCRYCGEHRTESGMQCPVCADEMTRQHKAWLTDHRLRNDIIGFQKFISDQQSDCRGQE